MTYIPSEGTNLQNEMEAKNQAAGKVLELLDNDKYIDPGHFATLLGQYKKRQKRVENEIYLSIKDQLMNITDTEELIKVSVQNIEVVQQNFKKMKETDHQTDKGNPIFDVMVIVRRNIQDFQNMLQDYLNLKDKIEGLQQALDNPRYYQEIWLQLTAMQELKESVLKKIGESDHQNDRNFGQFKRDFDALDKFHAKFIEKLHENLCGCIELSQVEQIEVLKQNFQILVEGDQILETQNKPQVYIQNFKEAVVKMISGRFDKMFGEYKDEIQQGQKLNDILEQSRFTIVDMTIIHEHVIKCFPKEYKIIELMEDEYRKNITNYFKPILQNTEELKKAPGNIIFLLAWLDQYQCQLQYAQVENPELLELKGLIDSTKPIYLDHQTKLFKEWLINIFKDDMNDNFKYELLKLKVNENLELSTQAPVDLFRNINQQNDNLQNCQVKGEMYMSNIKIWMQGIQTKLLKEIRGLKNFTAVKAHENFQEIDKIKGIDEIEKRDKKEEYASLIMIVFINNIGKSRKLLMKLGKSLVEFSQEAYEERIQNQIKRTQEGFFMFFLSKFQVFKDSINDCIKHLARLTVLELFDKEIKKQDENYEESILKMDLFSEAWFKNDINMMGTVCQAIQEYLTYVFEPLILNKAKYYSLIRILFIELIRMYFRRIFDIFTYDSKFCKELESIPGAIPTVEDMQGVVLKWQIKSQERAQKFYKRILKKFYKKKDRALIMKIGKLLTGVKRDMKSVEGLMSKNKHFGKQSSQELRRQIIQPFDTFIKMLTCPVNQFEQSLRYGGNTMYQNLDMCFGEFKYIAFMTCCIIRREKNKKDHESKWRVYMLKTIESQKNKNKKS